MRATTSKNDIVNDCPTIYPHSVANKTGTIWEICPFISKITTQIEIVCVRVAVTVIPPIIEYIPTSK